MDLKNDISPPTTTKNERPNHRQVQKMNKQKYHRSIVKTKAKPYHHHHTNIQDDKQEITSLNFLEINSSIDPTQFLTNYSLMPNIHFKQMLSTTIATDPNRNLFDQIWNNDDKLTYIRQLTDMINQMNYLKLQDEQWTYYYQLGMNEGIWTGHVSNKTSIFNSMCSTYGRSKHIIEQRQKKYHQDYEEINKKINDYIQQIPFSMIDINKMMCIINNLVKINQYPLYLLFQKHRDMLKFDANEHRLVQAFYDLKPRDTEIRSAKIIWKLVHDEQLLRDEINIFQAWLSFKTQSTTKHKIQDLQLKTIQDLLIQQLFDDESNFFQPLSIHCIENEMNHLKNILTIRTVSKAQEILQTYLQQIDQEKTKLFNNRDKYKNQATIDSIINAIENRRTNMIARAEYCSKYKLTVLFNQSSIDYHKQN